MHADRDYDMIVPQNDWHEIQTKTQVDGNEMGELDVEDA